MIECYFDGEYPAVYTRKRVKARKAHTCCECGGVIRRGETYEYVTGLWDGSWSTYRTCADCLHVRCETGCQNVPHGYLADAIADDRRLWAMFQAARASRREVA